ncbi:hypothetical protein M0813_09894 [Anaeramoeba flamelloides]|uniref:BTB domain-containing protein n=1 Tax=Anaeramoeba flamelloides TaxID=1746091 RepID=A0ABQ8X6R3_9EUKA|nr:hypothetical protein M0813_09894 [Anaeramoeba flamelloides]
MNFSYSCGQNVDGELAVGKKGEVFNLTPLQGYESKKIRSIASGFQRTIIVDIDGKITGYGNFSDLQFNKPVKKAVAGFHPCALVTFDDEVYFSERGKKLVLLSKPQGTTVVEIVPGLFAVYILYSNGDLYEKDSKIHSNVTRVFSGNYASNYFFIDNSGRLFASGKNENGQLGIGKVCKTVTKTELTEFRNQQITHISCGYQHSCMILSDNNGVGKVYGVGNNQYSGLGGSGNTSKFQLIPTLADFDAMFASVGCFHNIVLMKDYSVWGWGNNVYGQLGIGSKTSYKTPIQIHTEIFSNNEPRIVHCGPFNTFVYSKSSELQEETKKVTLQIKPPTSSIITNIPTENKTFCFCCGQNEQGELGSTENKNQTSLIQVKAFQGVPVQSLASGFKRTIIVDIDGKITGYGNFSKLQFNKPVKKAVAGFHPCALVTFDDQVYFSARGENPVLLSKPQGTTVVEIVPSLLTVYILYSNGDLYEKGSKIHSNVTRVFSGNYASNYFFIDNSGRLFASGKNENGQLGIGKVCKTVTKTELTEFKNQQIIHISCGYQHSCMILSDNNGVGKVYGVGNNQYSGLGGSGNTSKFQLIPTLADFNAMFIDIGCFHTIVLMKDYSVWGWGNNAYGQLGELKFTTIGQPTLLNLPPLGKNEPKIIHCGCFNTFFMSVRQSFNNNITFGGNQQKIENQQDEKKNPIQADNLENKNIFSYSCGQNVDGELAVGKKGEVFNLTPLQGYESKKIRSIASGFQRTIIVDIDGKITGYGKFSDLQFNKPVKKAVAGFHPCALVTFDDEVYFSERGNNLVLLSKPQGTTVVEIVPGLFTVYILYSNGDLYEKDSKIHSNVTRVFSGNYASNYFFIDNSGSLFASGKNDNGQLGIGKVCKTVTKTELTEFKNQQIIHISCGYQHSCMILSDNNGVGKVYGVGNNQYSGLGGSGNTSKFQLIPTLADFNAMFIDIGCFHTIVLMKDYSVWGWGNNAYGQLNTRVSTLFAYPTKLNLTPLSPQQRTKIHCGSFNTFVYSPIDVIEEMNKKAIDDKPIEVEELQINNEIFVYSCGQNVNGELAIEKKNQKLNPNLIQLPAFRNKKIQSIASGFERSIIVDIDGKITGYGNFSDLQFDKPVKKAVAGFYPCALVTFDDQVYFSVKGENPVLLSKPQGTTVVEIVPGLFTVYILYSNGDLYEKDSKIHSNVTRVFSGNYASNYFFIDNSGSLFASGKNDNGQLGIGKVCKTATKTELTEFRNQQIIHISCGYQHSCMILSDNNGVGKVYGVGNNQYSGLGGSGNTSKFQLIPTLADFDAMFIDIGCFHTIVQMKDYSVWGWGNNAYGQLGIGSSTTYEQPIQLFQTPLESNQPRKIHCGCFNTFIYSPNDEIFKSAQNETVMQLEPFQEDFLSLFEKQENCDTQAILVDSTTIKFHSILVIARTGKEGQNFAKVLSQYNNTQANIILVWIYTGFSQEKDQNVINLINDFCEKLNINYAEKEGYSGLLNDIQRLYYNEASKDMIWCVENKEIPVHKIILQARSKLFQKIILKDPNENYLTYNSQKSYQSMFTLIQYFYTDILDPKTSKSVLSELENINYFLLNPKSTLQNQISNLKK